MGTCFGMPSRHYHGHHDSYYDAGYRGTGSYLHDNYYRSRYPYEDPGYSTYYPEDDYDRPYMYPETLLYSREGLHYGHPVPAVPAVPYRGTYEREYY